MRTQRLDKMPRNIRQSTITQPPLKPFDPPRYESSPHVFLDGIYKGKRIPTAKGMFSTFGI